MGESRGIGAAGVRTSTQKPSQLSLFCKLLLPLLSLHNLSHLCYQLLPSLLTSWFGQPPATSCDDMPRLGPFCILPEPVSCLSVLFFNRMILRRSDIASYGRQFWFHLLLYSIVRPSLRPGRVGQRLWGKQSSSSSTNFIKFLPLHVLSIPFFYILHNFRHMETLDHLKLFEIHVLILFVVNCTVFQNITPRLGGGQSSQFHRHHDFYGQSFAKLVVRPLIL